MKSALNNFNYYRNYNGPNFCSKYPDETLKCNLYSGFRKDNAAKMTSIVMGDEFVPPLKIQNTDKNFDTYIHLYGLGDLHLMLMPNVDGLNNFVKSFNYNGEKTISSIHNTLDVIHKTNPKSSLYLFESGSSDTQALNNTKGIIPAHLHYIAGNNINFDTISKSFEKETGRNVVNFKNICIESLYDFLKDKTQNGQLGYKHILKQNSENRFDAAIFIENDDFITHKSQIISKVLSSLMYHSNNPQYYDWKAIDSEPINWSNIMKSRIQKNRVQNKIFMDKLKNLNLIQAL